MSIPKSAILIATAAMLAAAPSPDGALTLWYRQPGALPEVRRLLFAGSYADAAKLITDKVLVKPVRQMPYETIGNLQLTFPEANSSQPPRTRPPWS